MGRDKALLPFRGGSLAGNVAHAVQLAAGSVVVVGRPEFLDYPAIPDRYPGEGPLGGILTALEHTRAEWNLVVACDMPFLSRALLRQICEIEGNVVPRVDGRTQPLHARYTKSVKAIVDERMARGELRMLDLLEELQPTYLDFPMQRGFTNINTRLDIP